MPPMKPLLQLLVLAPLILSVSSLTAETFDSPLDLQKVMSIVQKHYVQPQKSHEITVIALNGMLSSLDRYSTYLEKMDLENKNIRTFGQFGGIGSTVRHIGGFVHLEKIYENAPADKANLKNGDFITAIDGNTLLKLSFEEALNLIRGKPGSTITLSIFRPSEIDPEKQNFNVDITRELVKISAINKYYSLDNDVLYIKVNSFSARVTQDLKNALEALITSHPLYKGLILDLRGNPGGLLNEAVALADLFIQQGLIVSAVYKPRGRTQTREYTATYGDLIKGKPLVVLIDNRSASASELISAAFKDNKRAIIMGTPSFGKGLIQQAIPVGKNQSISITVGEYFSLQRYSLNKKGIVPDILVDINKTILDNNNKPITLVKDKMEEIPLELRKTLSPDKLSSYETNIKTLILKEEDYKAKLEQGEDAQILVEDYLLHRAANLVESLRALQLQEQTP